jgi:hypothetical protein
LYVAVGGSCFCPCEGGFDELSGAFAGRVNSSSRASRAAMRAFCAAMWAPCAASRSSAATSGSVNAAISVFGMAQLGSDGKPGYPTGRIESLVIVSRDFRGFLTGSGVRWMIRFWNGAITPGVSNYGGTQLTEISIVN